MRPYLDNFINTLSNRRQERASSLLEDARVGKEQLERIANRLEQLSDFDPVRLNRDQKNFRIVPRVMVGNSMDIKDRIKNLFEVSNLVALLLNSHSALLSSEVKELEDELVAMEKMAHNLAFLFADNQAYDYAHLESFTDERGRSDMTLIPDRVGLNFGPSQFASIRVDEGILALPELTAGSHGLTVHRIRGNATAMTIHETELSNILREGSTTGWRMTIAAPGPVTAPLPQDEFNRNGVQVALSFELTDPAPSSEIKLIPFADMPLEILQVTVFDDEEDATGTKLLSAPRRLDRAITLHFPMRLVHHFHVTVNQPTFHRVTTDENALETRTRKLITELNRNSRKSMRYRRKRPFGISQIERRIQARVAGRKSNVVSLPSTDLHADEGPMAGAKIAELLRMGRSSEWLSIDERERIMRKALYDTDFFNINRMKRQGGDRSISRFGHIMELEGGEEPQAMDLFENFDGEMRIMPIREEGFNYLYNVGLHRVRIGVESPGFKGVFVSKALPAEGDIGEIKLKTSEDNYAAPLTDRHSPWMTSVEYSVSNRSEPEGEGDWLPILPNGITHVEGERFFVDDGRGFLRFTALESEDIKIYRNGYLFQPRSLIQGGPGEVIGARFDERLIAPDDIFTCDYTPTGDPNVIDFQAFGFEEPALVFAHDHTGSGEGFATTGSRNAVKLSNRPYINPSLAQESGYQPITVQLETGEVAENLTNYRTGQTAPFPSDDGYYYIHSGNRLIFNKAITHPFRVYYEYLENNVRVRVVLRCNSKDFVSPKVDFVHAKAKTRSSEATTS